LSQCPMPCKKRRRCWSSFFFSSRRRHTRSVSAFLLNRSSDLSHFCYSSFFGTCLQTPKATSSTLYFDSLTVNAGNGGFLHCIQMDTSVNAANQVVSVGADIAFDADPKFFACLVRFESSSVPTTLPTAYDVYPLDGRHDGGYYTVKDCVTIDVLPRTPGNNVYVGFMVWSNFTATKCRGL